MAYSICTTVYFWKKIFFFILQQICGKGKADVEKRIGYSMKTVSCQIIFLIERFVFSFRGDRKETADRSIYKYSLYFFNQKLDFPEEQQSLVFYSSIHFIILSNIFFVTFHRFFYGKNDILQI